jgi:hypothetical protein
VRLGLALVLLAACKEAPTPPSPTAPADCTKVAEIVSNFELGPGAKPEQRTPVVAKNLEGCKAAGVTVAEATCVAKAKDTWAVKACVPKMFGVPTAAVAPTGTNDCKSTTLRMREAIVADLPKDSGSAGLAMVDRMLVAIEAGCIEDGWPPAYRDCIVGAPSGDKVAFEKCEPLLTGELRMKLGERLKPIIQSQ